MKWFVARLKEPSTHAGLAAASAILMQMIPDMAVAAAQASAGPWVMVGAAILGVVLKEGPKD